jgi:exonuclease VII small subunit
VTNSNGGDSWVSGDVLDLSATISNNGIDTYNDGGMIRFFHVNGASETEIDTAIINTLSTSGSGSTQSVSAQFDTSSLPANAWDASLRVKITDTLGDGNSGNNEVNEEVLHDMPPICSNPTIIGDPEVDRGETVVVEVRGDPADGVDEMDTMVPKLQISVANADVWNSSIVMGGQTLMGEGTSNERYEFQFEPDSTMTSGLYDIRVQFADAGGQESDWVVKEDAFSLNNALPVITPEPYPSVKVEVETPVSMVGHISDMEMPLSELEITSTSPHFISWDSTTGKMTVIFDNIQRDVHGTPMPSGIYITVDDGEDTTSGTLLFNVIENGQPRWGAVPSTHMDEGSSESIMLSNYLSDTDDIGTSVDSSNLIVAVLENDNRDLITASVTGQTLNIETMDQDVFGQARLTLRASDGTQFSDTVVIVSVNNINDAPTIDLSEFDGMMLKKGEEKIIMLSDYMDDVDDENNEILVSVAASPEHSARHNMGTNTLTLGWDTTGDKTVIITVRDRHDDTATYTFTVVVYDALPLHVSDSDPSADIFVEIENGLVGKDARVTLTVVNANLGLNHIESEWQICSILDGICYEIQVIEHTGAQTSWTFPLSFERSSDGLRYNDQLKLTNINAVDTDGNDRKFHGPIYWNITEFPVDPTTMDSRELDAHIMTLENRIASLEVAIANLEEGTDEYVEKQSELDSAKDDHQSACAVDGAECISDDVQSQAESAESGSLNFTYIGIGMGVIIFILLSVLVLGGRKGNGDSFASLIDHTMVLPAADNVANSTYGGAQELFASPPPQAGPPLPAAGLPVGWTMEQWQHYGAQYLQENGL